VRVLRGKLHADSANLFAPLAEDSIGPRTWSPVMPTACIARNGWRVSRPMSVVEGANGSGERT
jgi:hypothetical protein